MGWLGWTEQQTLDTSIPAIEMAYEGRLEMLRLIAGIGPAQAAPPALPAETVFGALRAAAK